MLLAIISSKVSLVSLAPFSLERQLPTADFLLLSHRLLGLCYYFFFPQFTLSIDSPMAMSSSSLIFSSIPFLLNLDSEFCILDIEFFISESLI